MREIASRPSSTPQTIMKLLLLATVLWGATAYAGSPPCTCGHGTVKSSSPWCVCTCNAGYMQPDCSFASTDTVKMQVWYDYESRDFVSSLTVQALNANLATTSVRFVYATGSWNGKTLGVYTMDGRSAYNLKQAVDAVLQWTVDASITATYQEITVSEAAPVSPAAQIELYRSGAVVVTAEGVAYLAAALVVLLALAVGDACCCSSKNRADLIKNDIRNGLWDPKLGKDPVLRYIHEPPPE